MLVGEACLIDPVGAGQWVWAQVTLIDSISAPAGLPLSARAVAVSSLIGYTAPAAGTIETFTLTGLSVDGHAWFSGGAVVNGETRLPAFYTTGLTTFGALTPGLQALIEITPGVWQVVNAAHGD
jgi:hypothetical protein